MNETKSVNETKSEVNATLKDQVDCHQQLCNGVYINNESTAVTFSVICVTHAVFMCHWRGQFFLTVHPPYANVNRGCVCVCVFKFISPLWHNFVSKFSCKDISSLQAVKKNVADCFHGLLQYFKHPDPLQGIKMSGDCFSLLGSRTMSSHYVSCQGLVSSSIPLHPKDRCCLSCAHGLKPVTDKGPDKDGHTSAERSC